MRPIPAAAADSLDATAGIGQRGRTLVGHRVWPPRALGGLETIGAAACAARRAAAAPGYATARRMRHPGTYTPPTRRCRRRPPWGTGGHAGSPAGWRWMSRGGRGGGCLVRPPLVDTRPPPHVGGGRAEGPTRSQPLLLWLCSSPPPAAATHLCGASATLRRPPAATHNKSLELEATAAAAAAPAAPAPATAALE